MTYKIKNLHILFSLLFLILSIGVAFFLLREVDLKNKKFDEINAVWQAENSKREELRSLERIVKLIEPDRVLLETHFIHSGDIVPFLNMIENLARDTGSKAEIVSVDISADKKSLEVKFKNTGSFQNLLKFESLLEYLPYETEFELVELSKSTNIIVLDKNNKVPEWEGDFKIRLLTFIN